MSGTTHAGVLERVERLRTTVTDLEPFIDRADTLLRRALGYDVAVWAAIDPATLLMTDCRPRWDVPPPGGDAFDPARELHLFELEWTSGDPNTYVELAGSHRPAAALRATVGDPAGRVRRYDEVLAPNGAHDELRVVLRRGDAAWGVLSCYRRTPTPFGAREVELALRISPLLADTYRRAFLRAAVEHPGLDDPPGQLSVSGEAQVVTTTAAAEEHLSAIAHGQVPSVLRSLVAGIRGDGPTAAVVAGRDGPVALHAMAVKGRDDEYAVVVERPRPATLARVMMRAYGLTERERQVAVALLHGATSRRIARDLGVSVHTVNDHVKAIYAKVGVGSRGELSARLLTEHYLPKRARGATPGPYGYFL